MNEMKLGIYVKRLVPFFVFGHLMYCINMMQNGAYVIWIVSCVIIHSSFLLYYEFFQMKKIWMRFTLMFFISILSPFSTLQINLLY